MRLGGLAAGFACAAEALEAPAAARADASNAIVTTAAQPPPARYSIPRRGKAALRSRRRRSRITPSAHSCIDKISFSPFSVRTGKTRSFDRLSDALDERTIPSDSLALS
jgi:hypothetical protein